MFYSGGNELYSEEGDSPPKPILQGLKDLVSKYDHSRFLIPSTMDGGSDGSNMNLHDNDFALAPKDGPYGFLQPSSYYGENNPGLLDADPSSPLVISFQPEVGSSTVPSYESVKRMGLADDDSDFPSFCDSYIPKLWNYHNYEGYCIPEYNYSFVESYSSPRTIREFLENANLASIQQYQSLVEGFSLKMFDLASNGGKSAFIIWKTQSPWPSLRGFLYDWYLSTTGMYDGVVLGTGGGGSNKLKIVLDLDSMEVRLINRGLKSTNEDGFTGSSVDVSMYTVRGLEVSKQSFVLNNVDGMSVSPTNYLDNVVSWPEEYHNDVLFIRVTSSLFEEEESGKHPVSWYWLRSKESTPIATLFDFTELGLFRNVGPFPKVSAEFLSSLEIVDGNHGTNNNYADDESCLSYSTKISLSVSPNSPSIGFNPKFTFYYKRDDEYIDDRVLPVEMSDIPMVVLPGESHDIEGFIPCAVGGREIERVEVGFWAGDNVVVMLE